MSSTTAPNTAAKLEELDGKWEIFQGTLRKKPLMSFGHNRTVRRLARQLASHLSLDEFDILQNDGHASVPGGDSFVPNVAIIPVALMERSASNPRRFESYAVPLPFVAEVWSPSTGTYDVDTKLPGYQARGDAEIWRVHPFDKRVTIWRRQSDGCYVESSERTGTVALHALPDIRIDLDRLYGED